MTGMTEERAREILKGEIQPDGGLFNGGWYVAWTPGDKTVTLDEKFTAEELEAIAFWMRRSYAQDSSSAQCSFRNSTQGAGTRRNT